MVNAEKSDTTKTQLLQNRTPLSIYVSGKPFLIGEAAHLMPAFNTLWRNQALEDCGALLALFSNLTCKTLISKRLIMFDRVRGKRANRQQIVSSVPTLPVN
ncbi:hypothetical protein BGZ57DRAFT_896560 [Hyaloscypha finlandica]|nr:hypothetical protein BGZ57DRAFT_896560 [Hyaloscypha finlandica]